jgi:HTH-type transcriptional regulator/antitoxin HigA
MDIRPIHNDDDLRAALAEIERLWKSPAGSPEADRLEIFTVLVERYEEASWTAKDLDPVDMLEYAFTDMGRSQAELAALLGSRSRASEIMARKRPLTLDMIRKISAAWSIPLALLVKPYALSGGRPLTLQAPTP